MYIYILVNKYVTPNYGDSVFELTYNTYFHINHNQNNVEDLYSVLSFSLSLSHAGFNGFTFANFSRANFGCHIFILNESDILFLCFKDYSE